MKYKVKKGAEFDVAVVVVTIPKQKKSSALKMAVLLVAATFSLVFVASAIYGVETNDYTAFKAMLSLFQEVGKNLVKSK